MKPFLLLLVAMILISPKANSEDVKLLWEHTPMQSLIMTGDGKYLYEPNNSIIINTETSAVTPCEFGKLPNEYKTFGDSKFQYYIDSTKQIKIYDFENNSISYEDVSYINNVGNVSPLTYSRNYIIVNIYDGNSVYKVYVFDRRSKSVIYTYEFDKWTFPRFAMISANENGFFLIYEEKMISYDMRTGTKYCTVDGTAYGVQIDSPQRKFYPNDTTLILFNYTKIKTINPITNEIKYNTTDASTVFENISIMPNCDTLLKYGLKNYVYLYNINTNKVTAHKIAATTTVNIAMQGSSFFEYYIDSNKITKRDLIADTSIVLFRQADKKCNRYWDEAKELFKNKNVSSDKNGIFVISNSYYAYFIDYLSGNLINRIDNYSFNEINENGFWFKPNSQNRLMKFDFTSKMITDSTNRTKYKLIGDYFINSQYAITYKTNSSTPFAYIEDLKNERIIDSLKIEYDPAHSNPIPNSTWGIEYFDPKNNSALKKFSLLPMIYDAELYILPSMEKKYTWQFDQVSLSVVAPNNNSIAFVYKNNPKAVVFHNLETNRDDTLHTDFSIKRLIFAQHSKLFMLQDSALSTVVIYTYDDRKELTKLNIEGDIYPSNNLCYLIVNSKKNTHITCYQLDNFKYLSAVENPESEASISIYPNPSSEKLTIINGEKESINSVEIYNALGEMMQSQTFDSDSDISFNISDLSVGTYYVKLNYSTRSIFKAFVKK